MRRQVKKKVKSKSPKYKWRKSGILRTPYNSSIVDDSPDDQDLDDAHNFFLPEGLSIDDGIFPDFSIDIDEIEKEAKRIAPCNHKWAEYRGLVEAFEYCETCDEKRELKK